MFKGCFGNVNSFLGKWRRENDYLLIVLMRFSFFIGYFIDIVIFWVIKKFLNR